MISIEALLEDIYRAVGHLEQEVPSRSRLLADPMGLLALLAEGEERRVQTQERLGVPVPRFCMFSVTWRCNLSCVGCYAKRYTRGREMTTADIARVLAEARGLGTYMYIIVGGEPLTVDGLIPLLAAQGDSLMFLFTNGTLLTSDHVRQIAEATNILPVVSVEGSETMTDGRRGRDIGRDVNRAMRLLADAGVAFGCATMATHRNVELVTSREWFDGLWNNGARFCFLLDYVPFPQDLDPALVLTDADMAEKKRRVAERYAEGRPLVVNFPPDEYDSGPCQAAGRGFMHINADGFVEPCPFSHYASKNVRDEPLHAVLGSDFFREVRNFAECTKSRRGECLLFANDEQVRRLAERTGAFCTERLGEKKNM
jgi:MoaA/NifB/PqqE/SkfB family radical SAM enzyme